MTTHNNKTLAFNVDAVRERLWRSAAIPEALLHKAIKRLDEQLDATHTKFFTFQGEVKGQTELVDNAARLSAIDKVLSVAGAYQKEKEVNQGDRAVAMEIDPETGRFKIIVGMSVGALASPEQEAADELMTKPQTREMVSGPRHGDLVGLPPGASGNVLDEAPQVINLRTRLKTKEEIYRDMFKEDSD